MSDEGLISEKVGLLLLPAPVEPRIEVGCGVFWFCVWCVAWCCWCCCCWCCWFQFAALWAPVGEWRRKAAAAAAAAACCCCCCCCWLAWFALLEAAAAAASCCNSCCLSKASLMALKSGLTGEPLLVCAALC